MENWARELDCSAVHGPLGFTDMDREGMLVEGFDRRSCFFTYYNHPYYMQHMAALGYVKDVDWVENLISAPEDEKTIARWAKLSAYVQRRQKLHILEVRTRLGYFPLLKPFFQLVNEAYAPLYGTVDLTPAQVKKYSMKFAPLINPKLTCFVLNEQDELVAFGVSAPSIAEALKKSRGRLLPTGWVHVLHAFRKNDTIDLLLIAVRPDLQGKGVNAIILSTVSYTHLDVYKRQNKCGSFSAGMVSPRFSTCRRAPRPSRRNSRPTGVPAAAYFMALSSRISARRRSCTALPRTVSSGWMS